MKPDNESGADSGSRFRTTQWSVVMVAAQNKSPEGTAALARLYELYWFPLYAFSRRKGYSPHDTQDLTQGFFVDMMERRVLAQADRLKGKFRTFLLTCFQNYISVEAQRTRRVKRGGGIEIISLDLKDAEDRYLAEAIEYLTPERLFDAHWATTLLTEVLTLLRQAYVNEGRGPTFEALKVFLDPSDSHALP